jgi:hypothetical protein
LLRNIIGYCARCSEAIPTCGHVWQNAGTAKSFFSLILEIGAAKTSDVHSVAGMRTAKAAVTNGAGIIIKQIRAK